MLNIDNVITLANNEKYLVLDKVLYNDIEYYYIAKVNATETDIENNFKLVTVNITTDNKKIIEEVTGEDKLKEILPMFANEI